MTQNKKAKPAFDSTLKFGHAKTDHMFICDWEDSKSWSKPQIVPYQTFQIDPMNSTLHYAIECFEGLKAYKDAQGRPRLFRADLNMFRLKQSMKRISLPDFDGLELLECLKELVKLDKDWIPDKEGYSLYIRPTAISLCDKLGVAVPDKARLFIVCSPCGPYYASGFNPVKLYCDTENVRAFPKGAGEYKMGSNYGPTIAPGGKAVRKGYDQILWLCGDNVGEVGTSNIFFFWKNEQGEQELVTPALDSTILPGVTRDSVLRLAREMNRFKVTERVIKIQEIVKAINEERLIEAFGAGTAVIVSPIKQISYNGIDYDIKINPQHNAGELTLEFSNMIKSIQYGKVEHPWSILIE